MSTVARPHRLRFITERRANSAMADIVPRCDGVVTSGRRLGFALDERSVALTIRAMSASATTVDALFSGTTLTARCRDACAANKQLVQIDATAATRFASTLDLAQVKQPPGQCGG